MFILQPSHIIQTLTLDGLSKEVERGDSKSEGFKFVPFE